MNLLGLLLALELGDSARDSELARRLQRREPQAMADLYDRFGRLAYSLIFSVVRDTGVAEDLVQETFLRVWNRVGGFDPDRGALGPWLLAIARLRAGARPRLGPAERLRDVPRTIRFSWWLGFAGRALARRLRRVVGGTRRPRRSLVSQAR